MKYTIVLTTDGKEVFKRWTGDKREAAEILAASLVDAGVSENNATLAMQFLNDPPPVIDGTSVYSRDHRSVIDITIRQ